MKGKKQQEETKSQEPSVRVKRSMEITVNQDDWQVRISTDSGKPWLHIGKGRGFLLQGIYASFEDWERIASLVIRALMRFNEEGQP